MNRTSPHSGPSQKDACDNSAAPAAASADRDDHAKTGGAAPLDRPSVRVVSTHWWESAGDGGGCGGGGSAAAAAAVAAAAAAAAAALSSILMRSAATRNTRLLTTYIT